MEALTSKVGKGHKDWRIKVTKYSSLDVDGKKKNISLLVMMVG